MNRKAPKVNSVIDILVSAMKPQGIPELHVLVALSAFSSFSQRTIKKAIEVGVSSNLFRRENGVLFPGSRFADFSLEKSNKEEAKA